jgi:hypothetical protein
MRAIVIIVFIVLLNVSDVFAQPKGLAEAKVIQTMVYEFDPSRPVIHFDANPSGSLWFAVDKFGLRQDMIVAGKRIPISFNTIEFQTAQMSPDGNQLVWMGLERSYDSLGYNMTTTHIFEHTLRDGRIEERSVGKYTADYNTLQFFPQNRTWAAILPAANKVTQQGDKDLVLINGDIVSKNEPEPRMFAFDSTGKRWAYRSNRGQEEFLITSEGKKFLYRTTNTNPMLPSDLPSVMRFSPDIKLFNVLLDGRDYDFDFRAAATMFKTTYLTSRQDTAQMYLIFQGQKQPLFHWITNIVIDSSGKNIAYFAADPKTYQTQTSRVNNAVVVHNGKITAGPFMGANRLFLSPSGNKTAYSVIVDSVYKLYLDGKFIGECGEYSEIIWRNESVAAYVTITDRKKLYVVAGKKRSPLYDRIGRVGLTKDGKALEYLALRNNILYKVQQSL